MGRSPSGPMDPDLERGLILAGIGMLEHGSSGWKWSVGLPHVLGLDPESSEPGAEALMSVVDERDRTKVRAALARVRGGGDKETIDFRFHRLGQARWANTILAPGPGDGNMHAVIRDVTREMERSLEDRRRLEVETRDRALAEAALNESSELLRQLLGNIDQAFWVREAKTGAYLYLSPGCESFMGKGPSPTADMPVPFAARLHPDDAALMRQVMAPGAGNPVQSHEVRITDPDQNQEPRWAWVRTFPIRDENGRIRQLAGTATDVTARRAAIQALDGTRKRLEAVLDNTNEGILVHDPDGSVMDVNQRLLDMFELSRDQVMGMSIAGDLSGPDNPVGDLDAIWREVLAGLPKSFEWQARRPNDGRTFPVEVHLRSMDLAGEQAILACIRDTTRQKRREEEIRSLSRAVTQSPVTTIIAMPDGTITYANPKAEETTGYSLGELLGRHISTLRPDGEAEEMLADMLSAVSQGKTWYNEVPLRTKDGRDVWHSASVSPITDSKDAFTAFVAVMDDITERRKARERMRHMALHDSLTGLPNRALFTDRLQQAVERALRTTTKCALLYVDLDHFKPINDTLGHMAGDEVLREVAERFRGAVRKMDSVARIGGDEFTVLIQDMNGRTDADQAAARILACFDKPMRSHLPDKPLSASIGIALCPENGQDAETLLKVADKAMYAAKKAGRATYRYGK